MKKKIKDLTLMELSEICADNQDCEKCPLNMGGYDGVCYRQAFIIVNFGSKLRDREVEIKESKDE